MTREEAITILLNVGVREYSSLLSALEALGLLKFDKPILADKDYFRNWGTIKEAAENKNTPTNIIVRTLYASSFYSSKTQIADAIVDCLLAVNYKIIDCDQYEIIEKKPQSYYDGLEFKPMFKIKTPDREDLFAAQSKKYGVIRLTKYKDARGLCLIINDRIVYAEIG